MTREIRYSCKEEKKGKVNTGSDMVQICGGSQSVLVPNNTILEALGDRKFISNNSHGE